VIIRPLAERELTEAIIAVLKERDAQGRHTCGDFWTRTFPLSQDGLYRVPPTNEGVFL
jgi:hypothetical protein